MELRILVSKECFLINFNGREEFSQAVICLLCSDSVVFSATDYLTIWRSQTTTTTLNSGVKANFSHQLDHKSVVTTG